MPVSFSENTPATSTIPASTPSAVIDIEMRDRPKSDKPYRVGKKFAVNLAAPEMDQAKSERAAKFLTKITDEVCSETAESQLNSAVIDEIDPFWLTFNDAETEKRYCDFAFISSGFYGGKLYMLAALIILIASYSVFYHGGLSPATFRDKHWIALDVAFAANVLMIIAVFIEQLFPYREIMFLVVIITHWPGYTIMVLLGKDPATYRYAYLTGCYFFCTFTAQPRFSRIFPLLSVIPLVTLLGCTLGEPGYWSTHTTLEILYWPLVLVPLFMFRMFERRSRAAFLECERAMERVQLLEERIATSRAVVSKLFPPTATLDFLLERNPRFKIMPGVSFPPRSYCNTVCIVSDVANFTRWSSDAMPSILIKFLNKVFTLIDDAASHNDVEKMYTVGDVCVCAVFDPELLPAQRAVNAVRFALDVQEMFEKWNYIAVGASISALAVSSKSNELVRADSESGALTHALSQTGFEDSNGVNARKTKQEEKTEQQQREVEDSDNIAANSAYRARKPDDQMHQMRIGIAIGNASCVFIGHSPPRFDLFGVVVNEATTLKSLCQPGYVNISKPVQHLLESVGYNVQKAATPASDEDSRQAPQGASHASFLKNSFGAMAAAFGHGTARSGNLFASAAAAQASICISGIQRNERRHSSASVRSADMPLPAVAKPSMLNIMMLTDSPSKDQEDLPVGIAQLQDTTTATTLPTSSRAAATSTLSEEAVKVICTRIVALCATAAVEEVPQQKKLSPASARAPDSAELVTCAQREESERLVSQPLGTRRVSDISGIGKSSGGTSSEQPEENAELNQQQSQQQQNQEQSPAVNSLKNIMSAEEESKQKDQLDENDHDQIYEVDSNGDDEENSNTDHLAPNTNFSKFFLVFDDPQVENAFHESLRRSQFAKGPLYLMCIFQGAFIGCQIMIGCLDTLRSRAVVLVALGLLILFAGHLIQNGVTAWTRWLSLLCFTTLVPYSALAIDSSCRAAQYSSDIITLYLVTGTLTFVFTLDFELKYRIVTIVFADGMHYAWTALRKLIYDDDALQYELVPFIAIVAFSVVSYFADYALRSSFESKLRYHFFVHSASGRSAHMAHRMLNAVLPRFITDALLTTFDRGLAVFGDRNNQQSAAAAASQAPTSSAATAVSQQSAAPSPVTHLKRLGFKLRETIWDFPVLVVMYVALDERVLLANTIGEVPHETCAKETQKVIELWEMYAMRYGLVKINSFGNHTQWVAGVSSARFSSAADNDDSSDSWLAYVDLHTSSQRQKQSTTTLHSNGDGTASAPPVRTTRDAAGNNSNVTFHTVNCIRAALAMLAAVPEGAARAGIHAGRCSGALFGEHALTFDVFGTAASVASRLTAAAIRGQVLLSRETANLVTMRLDADCESFVVQPVAAVHLQGIGNVEVAEAVSK